MKHEYGLALPRIGLSLVFLWFGFEQLLHTMSWVSYVPQFFIENSPVDVTTLVHLNGAFEVVFGFALLFGICTRLSALLLALHLAHITAIVGFDSIGVRDFGIVMGALGVALTGADKLCIDSFFTTESQVNTFLHHDISTGKPTQDNIQTHNPFEASNYR